MSRDRHARRAPGWCRDKSSGAAEASTGPEPERRAARRYSREDGRGVWRQVKTGWGGRVGLYAGSCGRGALRRCPGRRPSISACRRRQALAVHPQARAGTPSNACAGRPLARPTLSTLLQVGFTEPPGSPRALVVSYTTLSPLPPQAAAAVFFLWHCPAGRPGLPLATTLPCGARTFLGRGLPRTRPPGRLVRRTSMIRRSDSP